MPPWAAKEEMGNLLLASEMPVPIPRSRTVHSLVLPDHPRIDGGLYGYAPRTVAVASRKNGQASGWREGGAAERLGGG